jgi:hydroxyethylthiazole kinase-like uncharacterized protein yjeF
MKPILNVAEMKAADEAAQKSMPIEVLIKRAGFMLAAEIMKRYRPHYGKKVAVIWGKGNNGKDGITAGGFLEKRGFKVLYMNVQDLKEIPACDIIIDACYGIGFKGKFSCPFYDKAARVVSADIPTGLSADTGIVEGEAFKADLTISFAAYKPGCFLNEGKYYSGELLLADIGIPINRTSMFLVEESDLVLPQKAFNAHKWDAGLSIIAGSMSMSGAPNLCVKGAQVMGAGIIHVGSNSRTFLITQNEAISYALTEESFIKDALDCINKTRAMVIGPGLGRDSKTVENIVSLINKVKDIAVIIDADALYAIASSKLNLRELNKSRRAPIVLTPHDGELKMLLGKSEIKDKLNDVRSFAAQSGCYVVSKGPVSLVASPQGEVYFINCGTPLLATAGTGDVLSGAIGALFARGLNPLEAVLTATYIHAKASSGLQSYAITAGELPKLMSKYLAQRL